MLFDNKCRLKKTDCLADLPTVHVYTCAFPHFVVRTVASRSPKKSVVKCRSNGISMQQKFASNFSALSREEPCASRREYALPKEAYADIAHLRMTSYL